MSEWPAVLGDPVSDPRAVITGRTWRITVLTPGLVRLEQAADGVFEDRASTFAVHRHLPVPEFRVVETSARLEVVTDRLVLSYDREPFSTSGLSVTVRGGVTSWHSTWRYGLPETVRGRGFDVGNLGGTARTLDDADGEIDLERGVASKNGYAVIDDSTSAVFAADGWFAPRDGSRKDLYVFVHGHDYHQALVDLFAVSGPQPLLPRWALGNWWSRYHPYTAQEYAQLMDTFAREGLPFSVAVLDMDWHLVDIDSALGSGWTGYTWNRALIPDPRAFLADLHSRGLHVTTNDHPADGIRAHEDAYPAMATAMGIDPASGDPVAFDVTDPRFVAAWLDVARRPVEDDGVDFWWMDWQQGTHSRVAGIDPLWVLNHVGYVDNRRGGRRALGFSRYAGPGSHRYPIGFSGDTIATWASLAFQAEFTATAANIGYGWWSHDIGGHQKGRSDDELSTRWLQLGVFSPILRLHSANSEFSGREPWNYGPAARAAMTSALRLRHRLVPYLHTMNHRAASDGVPLVTPMYHAHPDRPEAYRARTQFSFGSELMVAPITSPADAGTLTGSVTAWLPPGTWVDVFTGLVYDGDREIVMHRHLDDIPVLGSPGAIVPMDAEEVPGNDPVNPTALEVLVVVGADGSFTLVEDDGTGDGLDPALTARTAISFEQAGGVVTIGGVTGDASCVPARRSWRVTTPAHAGGPVTATLDGAPLEVSTGPSAERGGGWTSVLVEDVAVTATLRVMLGERPALADNDVVSRVLALLRPAQIPITTKEAVLAVVEAQAPRHTSLSSLTALDLGRPLETALAEVLLARGTGEPAGAPHRRS